MLHTYRQPAFPASKAAGVISAMNLNLLENVVETYC